jgi:4'-phosphopantetheinyl transferase
MTSRQSARNHSQIRRTITLPLPPHPWRPGDPPPALPLGTAPPLLLLIDSRLPLPPSKTLQRHLSPIDLQRHQTYRRPADRLRFLLGRASLRELLGHWLQQGPHTIRLEASALGKPHCPGGPAFNVSHSGALILLAFHASWAVGVDVERVRPDLPWEPIARRMFTPGELMALQAQPALEQASAFLATWCRLEARLKAAGLGLSGLASLRAAEASGDGPSPAQIWDVAVPFGYSAAVAMQPLSPVVRGRPVPVAGGGHPSLPG